jgi:hypothetical protein
MDEAGGEWSEGRDSIGLDLDGIAPIDAGQAMETWGDAVGNKARTAISLGFCLAACSLLLTFAFHAPSQPLSPRTLAQMGGSGQEDLVEAMALDGSSMGWERANAKALANPAWSKAFGSARFEPDALHPGQAVLILKDRAGLCKSLALWAPGRASRAGVDSIEAHSRLVWSAKDGSGESGCSGESSEGRVSVSVRMPTSDAR